MIRTVFCVVAVLLQTAIGFGQQSSSTQIPTFTSQSELVLVPVMIRDHGKPVSGLKKDSFVLKDDGKERQLAVFEEVRTSNIASPHAGVSDDIYRNFISGPQEPKRITIILVDLLNTPLNEHERMRQQTIKYLASHVIENEPTSLFMLDLWGLHELHSYTTNSSLLIAALRKLIAPGKMGFPRMSAEVQGPDLRPEAAAAFPDLAMESVLGKVAMLMKEKMEGADAQSTLNDSLATLRAFEQIANGYAGVPGRKSLVWMSRGIPFEIPEADAMAPGGMDMHFQRIWRALNSANIAVYPADATGLVPPQPYTRLTAVERTIGDGDGRSINKSFTNLAKQRTPRETLQAFARETGGRTCLNNNDLSECLQRAGEDSESYYMVGFYVQLKDRKPGWHNIKFSVKGDYSEIRYRNGYLIASPQVLQPLSDKDIVGHVASAPTDYTAVPMEVAINGITPTGAKRKVSYVIHLPPGAVTVDSSDNNALQFQFGVVVSDRKSKVLASVSRNATANPKPEAVAKYAREGIAFPDQIEVPVGEHQFRWVIRDGLTGKMGTVTATVQVK